MQGVAADEWLIVDSGGTFGRPVVDDGVWEAEPGAELLFGPGTEGGGGCRAVVFPVEGGTDPKEIIGEWDDLDALFVDMGSREARDGGDEDFAFVSRPGKGGEVGIGKVGDAAAVDDGFGGDVFIADGIGGYSEVGAVKFFG